MIAVVLLEILVRMIVMGCNLEMEGFEYKCSDRTRSFNELTVTGDMRVYIDGEYSGDLINIGVNYIEYKMRCKNKYLNGKIRKVYI